MMKAWSATVLAICWLLLQLGPDPVSLCSSSSFFLFLFLFLFFFWGTCLLLLCFFFFSLTNPFVQDLKLSDLLPIFVLLRVLSFLLDLIITSYRCIAQNSPEKLKQKETVQTSKTGHDSQNWAVGPRSVRVPAFFAWNGSSP